MKPARLVIWSFLTFILITELSVFSFPHQVRSDSATYPVISEVQIAGDAGANDEFIELYNPTAGSVDIGSWSIQTENTGGSFSKKNLVSPAVIPAYGYYLIANSTYNGSVTPDLSHNSFAMSTTGVTVFFVNNQTLLTTGNETSIVDRIGIGVNALDAEGAPFTPIPASGESAERKANLLSSSTTMNIGGSDEYGGNGFDTNNNVSDFILRAAAQPQNSGSAAEVPVVTVTPTPSPTPTPSSTPSPTLSASPTPSPTPSPTSTPTPSLTPTATPEPSATPTTTSSPTPTPELTPLPTSGADEIIRIPLPKKTFICTLEYLRIKWLFGFIAVPRIHCGYQ